MYELFASCRIIATEKIEMVTCDIPSAFLKSDWPSNKSMYLKFDRIMVEMLLEIDLTSTEHIRNRGRYRLMYSSLDNSVYETLMGAILFYEKLVTQLHKWTSS